MKCVKSATGFKSRETKAFGILRSILPSKVNIAKVGRSKEKVKLADDIALLIASADKDSDKKITEMMDNLRVLNGREK